jgi:hypothetical protein
MAWKVSLSSCVTPGTIRQRDISILMGCLPHQLLLVWRSPGSCHTPEAVGGIKPRVLYILG